MVGDKKEIRRQVLARREELGHNARQEKSQQIVKHLLSLSELLQAQTVMLFMDFRNEVETGQLVDYVLETGQCLILPRCAPQGQLDLYLVQNLAEDIEFGKWAIREPKMDLPSILPEAIDFVLVPGVAFDKEGNRLGYGGGYYDRFMKKLRPHVPRVAVAFDCQIVDSIPTGPYDQKITKLVTEQGVCFDQADG